MKYLMMSVIIFLGTTLLLFIFDRAAEYTSYPFSGHPNYVEPSSFPVFEVDLENATYLGDINSRSAVLICASLKEGSVLELTSPGGSMLAGWAIMECIKDRDIIVFHDAGGAEDAPRNTIGALRPLIRELKASYEFVTLEEGLKCSKM